MLENALDYAGLKYYDGKSKDYIDEKITDAQTEFQTQIDKKAPIASPTLTGTPKAPTANAGTNTTQIATTAFVQTEIGNLINGAPETANTLKELSDLIEEHQDVTDALNEAIGKKANASDLTSHTGNTTVHITATERTSWNNASTNSHTHSNKSVLDATTASYTTALNTKLSGIATGAEVNQNAFSNVVVGSTTIAADSKTDSLTIAAGSNVTITPDATNDKITIAATDTVYTHPTTSGNKHIPSGGSSGQILRWSADGTAVWGADNNTTYSNMTAATASAAGKAGLVPAPAAGKQTSFLRGDGTWVVPTNTTYGNFVKSGSGAKAGLVPAPSTTAGTTKYLREDGTWQVPPDTNTTYTLSSITGTLAVAKGGTGATTLASGRALIGNGTNAVTTRAINTLSAVGNIGYGSSNANNLATLSTLAFWNGQYTSNKSNLAYCNQGAFGTAATYAATTSITNGGTGLITSGAVYTGLSGKAPTSHATTALTYGGGTASNYGHVKLSDSYTTSAGAASASVAASSKAVADAYAEINSNLNIFPDYNNTVVLYATNDITNNTDFTITIPETAYYYAVVDTNTQNIRPFIRVTVNSKSVFNGYNASGNYMYLQTPLLLFKKGTVVVFNMDGAMRNIVKIPICSEIWEK